MNPIQTIYPLCGLLLGKNIPQLPDNQVLELAEFLLKNSDYLQSHPYLADLAHIEAARYIIAQNSSPLPQNITERIINPNLQLIEVHWTGLPELILGQNIIPLEKKGLVLVWQTPDEDNIQTLEANNHDLLALKIIGEKIDSHKAAIEGQVTIGTIDNILYHACQKGLIISPSSRIVRPPEFCRGEVQNQIFSQLPPLPCNGTLPRPATCTVATAMTAVNAQNQALTSASRYWTNSMISARIIMFTPRLLLRAATHLCTLISMNCTRKLLIGAL